ncbi:phosphoprotein Ser/Thr phosphatase [Plasmodium falciparum IGH-CR14]|uniref:Phosphoprotein Ser/Thr phosphatase n=1 Tax=Plasmodium falciparum IGH-CR14 TaxID=580059 RepID=A0A0L1IGP8_PLAFA|nr:phosphoprotein Ser/Thr phosphatase [Plasmodium falciparum IGH-CR14]
MLCDGMGGHYGGSKAAKEPTFRDMGTTLTASLIYPKEKHIYVFNVGDSRTYIYNGLLHQVTEDQNVMNQ